MARLLIPSPAISVCLLIYLMLTFTLQVSYFNPSVVATLAHPPPTVFDNTTDDLALLSFKSSITSDPSGALSSWNTSLHYCSWTGITCSHRHPQRVTVLNLQSKGLVGNLSPSLANLTFLRRLQLGNNSIAGRLPPEFGRLFRLEILNVSWNLLSGEIPANLSRCANLRYLAIWDNKITGEIPSELGSLARLQVMFLDSNAITGRIPPSLGNLSSVVSFVLGDNRLEGSIPEELGGLARLNFLALGFNMLSGSIPPSIYNLSALRVLFMGRNNLSGTLPQNLGCGLPNLEGLYIYENQFGGHLPSSFPNASRLRHIQLHRNNFDGAVPSNFGALLNLSWLTLGQNQLEGADWAFLSSLTNCSQLEVLSLEQNKLQGTLPSMFGNLSRKLQRLVISQNRISGGIPPEIGNLVNLVAVGMRYNLLTGTIPDTVASLGNLVELDLSYNKLSGKIPSSLGNLTHMSRLWLHVNDLEGRIPTSFGNYKSLELMDLSRNSLSGEIPRQVIGLRSLSQYLNLSHNSFTGTLPTEVSHLKNLQVLDVSENRLFGEIPTSLGDCEILEYLFMQGNSFHGPIPSSLIKLRGIREMDLSHNQLLGSIPDFLQSLQSLQLLNLSFNDFEGEVPKGGVFQNYGAYSIQGNPKLCGGDLRLYLQGCPILVSRKKHAPHKLKLIVAALATSVVCIILLLMFARYRRILNSKKEVLLSASSINAQYPRISYRELFQATHGFSRDSLLGQGSFGSVYKGMLEEGGQLVAVKVFNLQQYGASKSFMAECEVLRNIRHRNLVKIVTSCSSVDFNGNDFKALVFEFMPNGSLESWLHAEKCSSNPLKRLNFIQRLNIAFDVASALDYLHNHGDTPVIHCDLKPNNVLLDCNMCAHVCDFGLSKFIFGNNYEESKSLTSSIWMKGTIGYIAPEYGVGSQPSTLGDIYSFGILLLEMFTGKRPTDELLQEGLNLHKFVETFFPERVMNIMDPSILLPDGYEGVDHNIEDMDNKKQKLEECLVSIIKLGLLCSKESSEERMEMSNVVKEINILRDAFSGARIY